MKRFLTSVLVAAAVLSIAQAAFGTTATPVEMRQVCDNWLAQVTYEKGGWAGGQNPTVVGLHDIVVGDTVLARWYDISPRGYVLVTALKEMTPVKAYSDESNLTDLQENGFISMVREQTAGLFRQYVRTYGSLDAPQPATGDAVFGQGQLEKWNALTVSSDAYRATLDAAHRQAFLEAGPMLTSSWHQRAPYNNLCPMGDGGRCVVGCVATATAQILHFWQWPATGYGTHSYQWDGDQSCNHNTPGSELTADFSNAYDWANMPDSCDAGCAAAENAALAKLCSDVGIAFNMDYGACGSGANTSYAAYVFPAYFKYSSEARVEYRTAYDLPGWFGLIQTEIDAGRPIQYRIRSHSIVCDGYRQTGAQYEFHMNYGWGEGHTTWYVLDSLYCYWVPPDSVCPANEEFMITHIMPQTIAVLQHVGDTLTDVSGNGDGRAQAGETVAITTAVRNVGITATGITGTLTTSDPYVTITQGTSGYNDLGWGEQATSQTPYNLQVAPGCPDPHIASLQLTVRSPSGTGFTDTILVYIGNRTGFSDNMESGQGYWRHGLATPQTMEQWHLESYRYHSSGTSWKMGGAVELNYADGCDAALTTPPLLLPEKPKLTFWHRIDAEVQDDTLAWDGALVEISTGVGQWTELIPVGGYSHKLYMTTTIPAGTPVYSGSMDWTNAEFDLSAYSGVRQIRFRFTSDGAVNFEGWYVDDFAVTGCCQGTTGNVNTTGIVDLVDLSSLVNYLTGGGYILPCKASANVNATGIVDLVDLSSMVSYLTGGRYTLPNCQ